MLRGLIESPDPATLTDFLRQHLQTGALVQVAGEFEVLYSGRAASTADAGDYLLILKPDGSLQLHGPRGVKPQNWQPTSDSLDLTVEDGVAVLHSERFTPPEFVRVAFLQPALAMALELSHVTGFVLMGTEAGMQRALARNPEVIEPGLRLLDRELPTGVGGIDLYARDAQGRMVVVELKRGKATQEAVHQLARYVEAVTAQVGEQVRGILAAPGITGPARLQLEKLRLEFREVSALQEFIDDGPVQSPLFD